ncbi:MAG: hypothetical protein ACK56F_15015, partial [bacterium]
CSSMSSGTLIRFWYAWCLCMTWADAGRFHANSSHMPWHDTCASTVHSGQQCGFGCHTFSAMLDMLWKQ